MKRFGLTPLLVLAAVSTALLVAARSTPYFPGDLPFAQWIQSVAPAGDWARAITRAAYVPWIYGILAVSAIAALRLAGWRGAAAMIVVFFALMYAEPHIKGLIARPRPSADLIRVTGTAAAPAAMMAGAPAAPASYSMPSGWALLFGATVGLVGALALRNARGVVRAAYLIGCVFVLAAGLAARVALGQHWPSDVLAGYLLAITLGLAVYEGLATLKGRGQRTKGRGNDREEGRGRGKKG